MADRVWSDVLRALEGLVVARGDDGEVSVGEVFDLWIDGGVGEAVGRVSLELVWLGAIDDDEDGRRLLAIPSRINELAAALGDTYWQTLLRAPTKIVVAKSVQHRIRNVRHQVMLVDVDAWRAWALEHRSASELTPEELAAFADRFDDLFDRREAVAEDLKALKEEVKASGFEAKVLEDVVKMRRKLQQGDDKVVGKWRDGVDMMELYLDRLEVE